MKVTSDLPDLPEDKCLPLSHISKITVKFKEQSVPRPQSAGVECSHGWDSPRGHTRCPPGTETASGSRGVGRGGGRVPAGEALGTRFPLHYTVWVLSAFLFFATLIDYLFQIEYT